MRPATIAIVFALLTACQSVDTTQLDPANATFVINQRNVTLSKGVFEEPAAPGSAAKAATRLTDKRASGDLNGDGRPDAAVVLTFSGGGSGTFFYVAVLLNKGGGTGAATNAILLGDRIGVDVVRIEGGMIRVDTLDRKPGEAFTSSPSVRITRTFQVVGAALIEVR